MTATNMCSNFGGYKQGPPFHASTQELLVSSPAKGTISKLTSSATHPHGPRPNYGKGFPYLMNYS